MFFRKNFRVLRALFIQQSAAALNSTLFPPNCRRTSRALQASAVSFHNVVGTAELAASCGDRRNFYAGKLEGEYCEHTVFPDKTTCLTQSEFLVKVC
jgi:hypothetical protein